MISTIEKKELYFSIHIGKNRSTMFPRDLQFNGDVGKKGEMMRFKSSFWVCMVFAERRKKNDSSEKLPKI